MVVISLNEELFEIKLDAHDKQLEDHEREIDRIKESIHEDRIKQAETYVKIDNLVQSVQNLTSTIRWMMYGIIATLGGFFIWVIQTKLF